jgi:hypothetical protein
VATRPFDQDAFGLAFMQRAYELGKVAGRAESQGDRTETNYEWHSDDSGGESGPEM